MRVRASQAWYVYVVECSDGSLYTGVARDIEHRVAKHNEGKGAKYTRGRGPVRVVASSRPLGKSEAHRLEAYVKTLGPGKKVAAVSASPHPAARPRS